MYGPEKDRLALHALDGPATRPGDDTKAYSMIQYDTKAYSMLGSLVANMKLKGYEGKRRDLGFD